MADILPVSQMIQQPNLLGGFQQGLQFGQAQRDRRNNQQAAQLYAQAMQAPVEQRPALLAQIAQLTGVEGATTAQAGLGRQDSAAHDDLVQSASQFAAIAEADPATAQQMYPALAAKAHAVGIPVPTTYDPRFLPAIQKLATIGSPGGAVQSTYVDAQGNRVAIMRDGSHQVIGQNAPNMQIIDNGQGFYGVNKSNLAATPVTLGGAPQQAAPTQFTGVDGRPVQIDPNLPPAVQASIRANEGAYAQAPNMATAQIGQQPQQLRSMPKPADIRAEQAQAMQIAEFNAKQSHTLSPAEVAARGYRPGTIVQVDGFGNESVKQAPEGARNSMSDVDRRAILAAKQKVPQLQNAIRGLDRINDALKALQGGLVDTGPLDQFAQRYTKEGQELEAAVGGIQNSILALTRVPGIGSQSDLEARIAMLQYPSLDKNPETNARTLQNLRLFMQDLANAYQNVLSQPDAAPSTTHAPSASGASYDPLGIMQGGH
jgi:hypothetical protein